MHRFYLLLVFQVAVATGYAETTCDFYCIKDGGALCSQWDAILDSDGYLAWNCSVESQLEVSTTQPCEDEAASMGSCSGVPLPGFSPTIEGETYPSPGSALETGAYAGFDHNPTPSTDPADDPTNPLEIQLTPDAEQPHGNILSPNSVSSTVDLANTGSEDVFLFGFEPFEGAAFSFTDGLDLISLCGSILSPGSTCQINLDFTPDGDGLHSEMLTILADAMGGAPLSVTTNLWGTSLLSLDPSQGSGAISEGSLLNFGNVELGASASQTITLVNTGTVRVHQVFTTLSGFGFTFSGDNYPGLNGDCGDTLEAGASCSIELDFAPEKAAALEGVLSIQLIFENGTTDLVDIALVGTGTESNVNLSVVVQEGTEYDFGEVHTQNETVQAFTLVHNGTEPVTHLVPRSFFSMDFYYTGGTYPGSNGTCGTQLNPGETCTLEIAFWPQTEYQVSDYLELDVTFQSGSTEIVRTTLIGSGNFSLLPDADNDGIEDMMDNCPTTPNPDQMDTDLDGIGDACDSETIIDFDGDGIADENDNCPWDYNPDQLDMDMDGEGDACDFSVPDVDGDGFEDMMDNCPNTYNPDQMDTDLDGIGDACDSETIIDFDGDGIADENDNCPWDYNPDQTDMDMDGEGDACDFSLPDADGDGFEDMMDNCPNTYNPDQTDMDFNGIGDACEGI